MTAWPVTGFRHEGEKGRWRVAESIVKMSTDIIFGLSGVKRLCFQPAAAVMNDVNPRPGNVLEG